MHNEHEFNVFLVEPLAEEFEGVLRQNANLRRFSSLKEEDLVHEVTEADAIVIRAKGRITRAVIEAAPRLQVIGRHGVGVDHIDLNAAKERNIVVVNTPYANFWSTAEFTVGLMFAVTRNVVRGDTLVRQEQPWALADKLVGCELRGKSLGIVGMGRIGQAVASICGRAFHMPILYYDYKNRIWNAPDDIQARLCSLDELLSSADIVTIHVPSFPETQYLINADSLSRLKPTAFIINTSRGNIIDEKALIACLEKKQLAGAGLDVMEVEPLVGSRLQQMHNVVLTPHIASYTRESFNNMGEIVYDVLRVLRGEEPTYRVV